MITAIDNFCGAGGSTTGLVGAGINVIHAANHWDLAIESHAANHPKTEHSVVNLNMTSPRYFPRSDIAWFSPECTTHSPAGGRGKKERNGQLHLWKGVKPEDERSRMTAWNCVEFAEFFAFKYLVVENVCEMSEWGLFDAWINTFRLLDYRVNIVNFNSQFAGVAQSRDRIYVVLWKKDMPAPNLDFRPQAHCHECGEVGAIQSWKRLGVPGMSVGRWGAQYVYRCEKCLSVVVPDRVAAGTKIDWSLPSLRVGDRTKKPLVENTLRRLEKGLRRFYPDAFQENPRSAVTEDQGLINPDGFLQSNREDNRATHPDEPVHAITASGSHWLAQPPMAFIDTLRRDSCATKIDEPISTVMAQGNHHALVQVPGFFAGYHGGRDAVQSTDEPAWTIATSCQHGLVQPPEAFISSYYGNGGEAKISSPAPTIRTTAGHALVQPPLAAADIAELVQNCLYRMLEPDEAKRLMGFPDDYILLGNKRQRQKQAGNAVTPPVAKMIGAAIIEAFSRA